MVFKGMVFKSKYWFWEKNKGFFLNEYLNFGELKGSHGYPVLAFIQIIAILSVLMTTTST